MAWWQEAQTASGWSSLAVAACSAANAGGGDWEPVAVADGKGERGEGEHGGDGAGDAPGGEAHRGPEDGGG